MARWLPSGLVTFAFVDIVGSTQAFSRYGDRYVAASLAVHATIADRVRERGGVVVSTEGDGAFLAFESAYGAVAALAAVQADIEATDPGPDGPDGAPRLRLRAGAHTGEATPVGEGYVALAVHVAARVAATANAGQVVVSEETARHAGARGAPVGVFALKDVVDPMRLWRLVGDETPLRAPAWRRTNVRVPVTEFVGRAAERAELAALVETRRLVTVVGPGGTGKTRLVSELALDLAGVTPGGVWLVELASLSTADQVAPAVASAAGVVADASVSDLAATLGRHGRAVVVMDNCEHLLDPVADVVEELLARSDDLVVVCTSREALRLPDERVWRLAPLTDPIAAARLFTGHATAAGAVVEQLAPDQVVELCAALDWLPLAIELAASQVATTGLDKLLRLVAEGEEPLARRGRPARQRSLDTMLQWSLTRLPPAQRRALLTLSVLPGRFDVVMGRALLEATAGCDVDAVRALARASLLDLDGEEYRMLDTIRHAARRSLVEDPALDGAARSALRAWAVGLSRDHYRSPDPGAILTPGVLMALDAAFTAGVDDEAAGVVEGLGYVASLLLRPDDHAPRVRIDAATRVLRRRPLVREPYTADQALLHYGSLCILSYQSEDLVLAPHEIDVLAERADAQVGGFPAAQLHRMAIHVHLGAGQYDAAMSHVEPWARFARSPDAMASAIAATHFQAALIHQRAGDAEAAAEGYLRATRALLDRVDGHHATAEVLGVTAAALLDVGRIEEGREHALAAMRRRSTGRIRHQVLTTLARALVMSGEGATGLSVARQAEAEVLSSPPGTAREHDLQALRRHVPALTTLNRPTAGDEPTPDALS